MKPQKSSLEDRVRNKVAFMPSPELRLMVEFADAELTARRDKWVREMCEQFSRMEEANMAYVICAIDPRTKHSADRVIVNCFSDKNRSKVATGISRLSPADCFDWDTGIAIAFARAMGKQVPDLF